MENGDYGLEALVKKPETAQFKKTADRLRSGAKAQLQHRNTIDWRLDQRSVCDIGGADADIVPLDTLKEMLMQSETARGLMTGEMTEKLDIVYDTQTQISQYYASAEKQVIALNPLRPFGDLVNALSRELRRNHQYHQGALVNPLSYEPEEAVHVNRAQVADAFMASVKIAWELKLLGEAQAWNDLAGSPFGDITRTFEIKAQSDFRTLNNGEAARAAYDKFFEGNRTRQYDKRVIHQMLLEETGYIKSRDSRKKLGMDLFKRLGEMPKGKNYLSMNAKMVPTDSAYAAVEDRSNANFLWFIKFERSFQEKELQLIAESVKLSAEIVDFAKWSATRQHA